MKTHAIQVTNHDDLNSIKDKMTWGKTHRLLIVIPFQEGVISMREFDLVLLARHAKSLGAQFALVTQDAITTTNAKRLGLPVFSDTDSAYQSSWSRRYDKRISHIDTIRPPTLNTVSNLNIYSKPASRQRKNLHLFFRLIAFFLGISSVLTVAAFLIPTAEITIHPTQIDHSLTLDVFSNPGIVSVSPAGAIPTTIRQIIVEGRSSIPTTGSISLPDSFAAGTIIFTNLTDQDISIPLGTIVKTTTPNPIQFATTNTAVLPAGQGNSIDVPIRALSPGSTGNVDANQIQVLGGILGLQIDITNPDGTIGGTDNIFNAPSQLDRNKLLESLSHALQQSALDDFSAQLNENDIMLTDTPRLLQITEKTFSPSSDSPADTLHLTLRAEYEILLIEGENLEILAHSVMPLSMLDGYAKASEFMDVSYSSLPIINEEDEVTWSITLQQPIQRSTDPDLISRSILGKTPTQAILVISHVFPDFPPPTIKLTPTWWFRLPILPNRISIQMEHQP